jgi:hypothetical protein
VYLSTCPRKNWLRLVPFFAGDQVLGLVEAQCTIVADAPQRTAFVLGENGLSGILHHRNAMPVGDVHDGVHLAGDTGVVDHANGLGLCGDGRFNQPFVDIERVFPDINEDGHCSTQGKCIGGGDKGVRGHDHLVAGLQVKQQRGHLQCSGAAVGQQGMAGLGVLLQPDMAFLGELPIAGEVAVGMGLRDVPQLAACHVRLVEGNHQ